MSGLFGLMCLMADASAVPTNPDGSGMLLTGLVGSLGGGAFSVWYGFHTTTKTIPKIIDDHREERKEDRQERLEFQQNVKELTAAINGLGCRQVSQL